MCISNGLYLHSLQFTGMTAEEFIKPQISDGGISATDDQPSKLEVFIEQMSMLLGNQPNETDVFSVLDTPGMVNHVDVMFAAHGSPNYRASRLNGLLLQNKVAVCIKLIINNIYSSNP